MDRFIYHQWVSSIFLILLLILACGKLHAQVPNNIIRPVDKVMMTFSDQELDSFSLFSHAPERKKADPMIRSIDPGVLYMDIDPNALSILNSSVPTGFQMLIPNPLRRGNMILELAKVDIFSRDFQAVLASSGEKVEVETGVHYQGIIKGKPTSLVAMSIFPNAVMGLISSNDGNLVLGKVNPTSKFDQLHILYNDQNILSGQDVSCQMKDPIRKNLPKSVNSFGQRRTVGDCIRLSTEVNHDIYLDKGGLAGTVNFISGIMLQVITLYNNESINLSLSEMIIWDVVSPYSGDSAHHMLAQFQDVREGFNGDLAQLISLEPKGGIAAGFNGICNPSPDSSMAYNGIHNFYHPFPTYSWTVKVITHELGHLFGSYHTHACIWNGNNTAIDGCWETEGNCPEPAIPAEGGTIMSYCETKSVGINFSLGFGQEPGDSIRSRVANAVCTSPCDPPSCEDFIQNGQETGIDCGGPDCPPCPSCSDGIKNGEEIGIDCGGRYVRTVRHSTFKSGRLMNSEDGERIDCMRLLRTATEVFLSQVGVVLTSLIWPI